MTSKFAFACVLTVTLTLLGAPLAGQITLVPIGDPEPADADAKQDKNPDLKKLVWKLADDRQWWTVRSKLIKLCQQGHEDEIVTLTGHFWRAHKDPHVRRRGMSVVGALNRINTEKRIREEVNAEVAAMRKAIDRLQTRLEDKTGKLERAELRRLSGVVDSSLRRLEQVMRHDAAMRKVKGLKLNMDTRTITPVDDKGNPLEEEEGAKPKTRKAPVKKASRSGNDAEKGGVRPVKETAATKRKGDMRRIKWIRPFKKARAASAAQQRIMLIKPVMGGTNKPDPYGVPCGGVNDCEGSW